MYRWNNPIPPPNPGPETPIGERDSKGKKRGNTPMFGDEEDFGEDVDEDWIIDDLGGAGVTMDESKEKEKGYAREIGK